MAATYKIAVIIEGKDNLSKPLGGVKRALGGLGGAFGKAGTAITAGLGAVTATAFGLAKSAAPLEGIEKAFYSLTGAAGDDMLAALKKGSAGMVAQSDLMRTYNTAAQLVGTTFAEQLPDAMGYLTKVSAATGTSMGYLMDSLTTGVGRLSPKILDNLNVQVDLNKAYEDYGKKIGKTAKELDKGEQQAAVMAQVMEMLATNTANLPDITDSAEASWAALMATIKDLKDMIGKALLPIFRAILKPMAALVERYGPLIVEWVEKAVAWFTDLPEPVQMVATGLGALAAVITGAMAVAGPLIGVLGGILGALAGLAAPLGLIIAAVAALAAAWMTDFGGIRTTTMQVIKAVRPVIEHFISTVVAWFQEHWPQIRAAVETVWSAVQAVTQAVISAVAPFVEEMMGKVVAWVQENWPLIQETVSTVLNAIWRGVQFVLTAITTFWAKHGETIMQIVSLAWENVKVVISTALDVLLGIFTLMMQVITGDWEGAWETIKGIARTITDAIVEITRNNLDMILAFFGTSLAELLEKVQTKFGEIKQAVTDTMDKIVAFLEGIDLAEIGAAIMESLKSGILSKVQSIIDAVREAIRRIIEEAKEALDMFSPSRVFVDIGENIMKSMATGMANKSLMPAYAMHGAIGTMTGEARRSPGTGTAGMIILAPILLSAADFVNAAGEVDYQAIGQRLREMQGAI